VPLYYVVFLSVNSLDSSHALQELESEDEEVDDDAEDEHEHETEDATPAEPAMNKAAAPPAPPKDTERQLSKKELKKKELEELDAILAELELSSKSNNDAQNETNGKF
jgi:cbb3-type cytochrome oxidase cytochrome c subunit